MDDEIKELIDAYIEFEKTPQGSDKREGLFWTFEKFDELSSENPQSLWEALLEILNRIPSDEIEGMMAAGILEDFIDNHGVEFVEIIVNEAKRNSRLCTLLGGVYECSTDTVWVQIMNVRGDEW
ncbi:MAG TPA: hypothetical protein VLB82_12215 [Thermodesulfobacteriota bacterium]|nr:hypothetical protein [Thermodesulfobacteriota bacterium]